VPCFGGCYAAGVQRAFERLSWAALAFVIGVILWGAYVRASGSGAGCGSHWPMCNGEVLPAAPSTKTLIELSHRITSAMAALFVLAQLILSRRAYSKGHRVRRAAGWAGFFMVTEVLVGAGIVLLEYVADNLSVGRAVWMAVHLVNTFLLVAAMTLTAHFASGGPSFSLRAPRHFGMLAVLALGSILLVGVSGAIAALGDTLFPAENLGTALAADLSPTAHILVRLRIAHPFLAVGGAFVVLATRYLIQSRSEHLPGVARWGKVVRLSIFAQMALGVTNVMLLAPIPLQIAHLLLADVVWIALVLFLASALVAAPEVVDAPFEAAPRAA
jgi:heme a synthase